MDGRMLSALRGLSISVSAFRVAMRLAGRLRFSATGPGLAPATDRWLRVPGVRGLIRSTPGSLSSGIA